MADDTADQIRALKGQLTRYGLLSEAVLLIAETPDLERLLTGSINKLKWVLDFERCTLALIKEDGASFALRTLLETRRDVAKFDQSAVPLRNGISGEVIRNKRMRLPGSTQSWFPGRSVPSQLSWVSPTAGTGRTGQFDWQARRANSPQARSPRHTRG